jgi:hypothetical protein
MLDTAVVEPRCALNLNSGSANDWAIRTITWVLLAFDCRLAKSMTSPTPSLVGYRVMRMAVSTRKLR